MKLSLSAKISITVLGLISVGGAVSAYLVYTQSTSLLKRSIGSGQSQLTTQSLNKIDRFLYERSVDMQELADQQSVQQYLGQPAARGSGPTTQLLQRLNRYRILGGAWENISLVDSKGAVLTSTDDVAVVSKLQRQAQFADAYRQALAGEPVYTDLFHEQAEDASIMLFMAPVRDTTSPGQPLAGVVVGELAWPSTLEILRTIQDSRAVLLNKQGVVIGDAANSAGSDVLTENKAGSAAFQKARHGSTGTTVAPSLDADSKDSPGFVTSYATEDGYLDYHGNGWVLVLQAPTKVAFAPVTELTKRLVATFAVILLLSAAIFLYLLNRQIERPVSRLLGTVERLAKGDFSTRLHLTTSDEWGMLAGAFNNMADKLESAYKDLRATMGVMQNERNRLQTILDKLPVGVYVAKAPSAEPVLINKAGVRLLGIDVRHANDASTKYTILREDGSPYPEQEQPLMVTLRTGQPAAKDDLLIEKKDGTTRALRIITAPITDADGILDGGVAVMEDITQERELERSRDEFFSIASHELRTPLTAIRGNASLIRQHLWKDVGNDTLKDMITDIHDSAVRLTEIVNDFLDTSRLEQQRMNFAFEPVDLADLTRSVIKEYQAAGQDGKTALTVTMPDQPLPLVWADRNRTKQVLINLVGNSLKFTSGGTVTVSFAVETDSVRTVVADSGQGMSAEAQKRLFKKFEQSGDTVLTRDSVRGTGLGLYISKLIMTQMHGHIHLDASEPGKGSTFSFSLPIAPDPTATMPDATVS